MNAAVVLSVIAFAAPGPVTGVGAPQRQVVAQNLFAADLFAFAEKAIAEQRFDDARTLLFALISDRDRDVRLEAEFRIAKLDAASGKSRDAAVRLRRILDERPDAQPVRLELAAQLAQMGDLAAARRELRYARAGFLPPEVAQLVDRFSQSLRSSKSFGGSVQFGTTADSNINRATRSDTLGTVIGDFTLDEDAKGKSGYGLSIDSQAYFRLPIGAHRLTVTGSQSADLYRHKQFNDVSAELKAGPELSIRAANLSLTVGITRRWFGGDRFMDSAALQATLAGPLTPRTQGRLNLSAAKVKNHRNQLEDGRSFSASVEMERALSLRTGVGIAFSAIRQDLRDPGYSTRSGQLTLVGYQTVGRMTFVASGSVGRLVADDRLLLYPEKRDDWTKRLGLGLTFRRFELLGFSPSAQFSWERNESSIEIYDYRRRAFELGIAKAF